MNTEIGYIPSGINLTIYYIIISIIGILFFIFMKKDKLSLLLLIIFFAGVFSFLGDTADNIYKILILCFTVLLFVDKKGMLVDIKLLYIFILLSVSFLVTFISNKDPLFYSFSQYTKLLIPFLLLIYFVNNLTTIESNLYYLKLVLSFILLQVLFSVIKYVVIGFSEPVVGSVTFMGGNPATILPILGLFIIYVINDGYLKIKDITILSLMLIISIMSFKRIIWFLYPTTLVILNFIMGKTKYLKYIFILAPLIFYLGVRLNPTLNAENKIWGSFDFLYAIEYAQEYSGLESSQNQNPTSGRFAGNILMVKNIAKEISNFSTWFGYGPKAIYGISYDDYEKGNWIWGVQDKGSLTGAARFLIAYGLAGLILYIFTIVLFFYNISNKKYRFFIIIFFLLEFCFYLDTFIITSIMVPLLLLSNFINIRENLITPFYINNN